MINNKHYNLVIVGAGIVGVLTAYLVCKYIKNFKVLLIDKNQLGNGCTYHSLGLEFGYGQTHQKLLYTEESLLMWQEIRNEIHDIPFYKRDFIGIISKEKFTHTKNYFHKKHFEIYLDQKLNYNLDNMFKINLQEQIFLKGNNVGYSDTHQVTKKIIEYCQSINQNFVLCESIKVESVATEGNKINILLSTKHTIQSDYCIAAVGPWLLNSPFYRLIENKSNLKLKKIVTFNLSSSTVINYPVVYFFDHDSFFLPLNTKNKFALSINSPDYFPSINVEKIKITGNDYQIAKNVMNNYFQNNEFSICGGRVFKDLYSHDYTPEVYIPSGVNNLSIITGFSGSGFRLAPALSLKAINVLGLLK